MEIFPFRRATPREAIDRILYAVDEYEQQWRRSADIGIFYVPHPDHTIDRGTRYIVDMFNAENAEELQNLSTALYMYAGFLLHNADRIARLHQNANILNR